MQAATVYRMPRSVVCHPPGPLVLGPAVVALLLPDFLHDRCRRNPTRRAGFAWGSAAAGAVLAVSGGRSARRHICQSTGAAFELTSVCGQPSKPYAASQLRQQGSLDDGFSVAAVSTAGLKGRGASVNQDCLAVRCKAGSWCIAVVADGHGRDGHHCATYICHNLPTLLAGALTAVSAGVSETEAEAPLTAAFTQAEMGLEKAACTHSFDVESAGCACVTAAFIPGEDTVYVASCGDCQAVLVDCATGDFKTNVPHKAHDRAEMQRIKAMGGKVRVDRQGDEVFSRVYSPSGVFGLAMSRAFGDLDVKRHGVIADPSVMAWRLRKPSCCVLGSDGLFEFISPAEVAAALQQHLDSKGAAACAEALVAEAQRCWKQVEGDYCDDVTCLVLTSGGDHPTKVDAPVLLD